MREERKNYKYTPKGHCECEERKATEDEIKEARKLFEETANNNPESIGMRSCYECNEAHAHLMSDYIFRCFGCGKIYVNGIDVMDYSEERRANEKN